MICTHKCNQTSFRIVQFIRTWNSRLWGAATAH